MLAEVNVIYHQNIYAKFLLSSLNSFFSMHS